MAAVRCGGKPRVNSGSATATAGQHFGMKNDFFAVGAGNNGGASDFCAVPAVVGTATMGGMSGLARRQLSPTSSKSQMDGFDCG